MDLTLFIVINTVNSLKKDIKNLNACANVKDNPDNNEKMIDTFKNGLEYLKNFL